MKVSNSERRLCSGVDAGGRMVGWNGSVRHIVYRGQCGGSGGASDPAGLSSEAARIPFQGICEDG